MFLRLVLILICCGNVRAASTVTFGEGPTEFSMEFVEIGSPGNANDVDPFFNFPASEEGSGAVDYVYEMGKFEVTCDQFDRAKLAGVFAFMGVTPDSLSYCRAGELNRPITSGYPEARAFVNWINTSLGYPPAYDNLGTQQVSRNQEARFFIPNADEWHKAAFYDPSQGLYFDYATGSDEAPIPVPFGTEPGTAVYSKVLDGGNYADVMQAGGLSPFGTMGQTGNVREWDEDTRYYFGGLYSQPGDIAWSSRGRSVGGTAGLRIVRIPEPDSGVMGLLAAGLTVFLLRSCGRSRYRSRRRVVI